MAVKSDTRPFSAPQSDFALVKVSEWSGDDKESRIYRISANILDLLERYLEEGFIAKEIRNDLMQALSNLPAWASLSLDSLNATQRQAVVGTFISANFGEVKVDCEVNLPSY